ncbi:MAG: hypothetical protein BJ554DRAFT_2500 [Olpidium bornovanus]|uniref:Dynein regulatory complex protein 9 n=1 Tax=Olpidium bornovanus TaxID=278681 RepID=A0A8H7ZQW5_9FUNG|nr:MAG: hypothetical protein BJ554DRAFT_2500 [Olpidium bornovanus]
MRLKVHGQRAAAARPALERRARERRRRRQQQRRRRRAGHLASAGDPETAAAAGQESAVHRRARGRARPTRRTWRHHARGRRPRRREAGDQKVLESKYQRLVQEQNTLKALPNKTKYKESQLAIMDVTNELQQNTYVLARNLKSHPSVAQNLLKIQTERSTLQALISKTIRELKEYRFDSLSATVEEEYRKKNILKNTIQQEKAAMEMLKGLQRELGNEKVVLEEEKNERALVIQQLKDTIQEINALTTSEQKYIKKETKAHEASVRQQCQMKEQALQEEKANLQKQIEQELKAHDKIVEFLNHQRSQLEQQIQQWMVKYEEDTEAKAKELEDLKQRRAQDLDKYEELVVKYEELERIVEDDRETRRKVAEEQRELAVKDKACRRIQRWWRRLRSVKLVEAKSAKKPAKSAKKKGSGKKSAKAPKKGKK